MIFFTADNHFGHAGIIKHCNRPFPDVTSMDATMILLWNGVVGKNDTVYILGDFIWNPMKAVEERVAELNGHKYLVLGSHDHRPKLHKCKIFVHIYEAWARLRVGEHRFFMCHYPLATWPSEGHGVYHLHGHSHGLLAPKTRRLDVGVDGHNFYPWSLDEVLRHFAKEKEILEHYQEVFKGTELYRPVDKKADDVI